MNKYSVNITHEGFGSLQHVTANNPDEAMHKARVEFVQELKELGYEGEDLIETVYADYIIKGHIVTISDLYEN